MFKSCLSQHIELFERLRTVEQSVATAGKLIGAAIAEGRKLMLCGNGGSAADSQHIAAEFVGRFIKDRRALPAIALSTDTSALTCVGNDYGFEFVYRRQVEALGNEGDVLIGISTSGNSPNVIEAVDAAKRIGMYTIGLLGRDGGKIRDQVDLPIVVPSDVTARIQEAHIFIGHVLCSLVEKQLGYE